MANLIRKRREERAPLSAREYTRPDPFQLVKSLFGAEPFRDWEAMFPLASGFSPDIELKETKDAYIFKADLPGIGENDVEIESMGNRVTIRGRRAEEEEQEDERYYAYERSYGSFSRSFTLPEAVDVSKIEAQMKDGVLSLRIPKLPEVQPKKVMVGFAKAGSEAKKAEAEASTTSEAPAASTEEEAEEGVKEKAA